MKKMAVSGALLVLVAIIAMACNGGGSPNGDGGTRATPTSRPAQILEVEISSEGIKPQHYDMVVGEFYVFRVTNTSSRERKFRAEKWQVTVPVLPGETKDSGSFNSTFVDESSCFEESRASRPEFKCTISIKAAN